MKNETGSWTTVCGEETCEQSNSQLKFSGRAEEPNFELLEQGCRTLNAKCSRCVKGEVIASVAGLAEALDAAKAM